MDENEKSVKVSQQPSCLRRISRTIISNFECFFFKWGNVITRNPWSFIISCLIVTAAFSIGMLNFTTENRPTKLWIPQDSGFVQNTEWLQENFPNELRPHSVIFVADNVLKPDILKWMLHIHENVGNITSENGYHWSQICFKLPVVSATANNRPKRQVKEDDLFDDFDFGDFDSAFDDSFQIDYESSDTFEPSIDLPLGLFCDIVAGFNEACFENNILEIWNYDMKVISNLSEEDILRDVNKIHKSNLTGIEYSKLLGKLRYNESGHIIAAESALTQFFTRINYSIIESGSVTNDAGTGDLVDVVGLEWENSLVKLLLNVTNGPEGSYLRFMASRSFGDISGATILGDVRYLAAGIIVVFIYVQLMLGKFNLVEQRAFLSLMGIGSVAMAIFVSYGVCSALGIFYGPVHSILPFLLLGIGIDDMFVIVQCWSNLNEEEMKKSLPVRVGTALKHAGVSITITSVTDFVAFAIGSTTVLPSLRSFCIYSAVGILGTYIFQATFFVAWFSLDQRRIESFRDGLVFCYKHRDWKPNRFSKMEPLQAFFRKILSEYLFKWPVKMFIMLLTVTSLGFNIWGTILMRQEFNPLWFLPQSSYLSQYFKTLEGYYPNNGAVGMVYMKTDNLSSHLLDLDHLVSDLRNETEILSNVEAWYDGFKEFINKRYSFDPTTQNITDKQFRAYLKNYLFTQKGAKFRANFKFEKPLDCLDDEASNILVSSFSFVFKPFSGRVEHIPAMKKVKNITKYYSSVVKGHIFSSSPAYATWETDEVIMEELYRNIAIAMVCIFCTTLILIANIQACLFVFLCVLLTLVCVNGTMHFWGLTIDTVSCINLVLAIGLCVDYAAHVAHTFMTKSGTRDERAAATVSSIGPAVFHGGFSTFLTFIFLADSDSHVFTTFFKVFVLVVIYGLYHGLIFLPVLLSIIGPVQYYEEEVDSNIDQPEKMELRSAAVAPSEMAVKESS